MGKLSIIWRIGATWYVSLVLLAGIGVTIGYFVFFEVYPGKPKIGVIDIPFTTLNDNSAFQISAFLDYARSKDDIKAVVIRLNSPGGSAAASELVYTETSNLREEKPVVITMGDIVASGAFLMSMGANYTYAKASSAVGNVGVILSFPGPLIPDLPNEDVISTGPFKLGGGSRRHWIQVADQIKQSFAQTVIAERGDRLQLGADNLLQGKIYAGVESVRLGLVDEIGGDTQAIQKAADLAGISNYEMVDINVEVFRLFNEKTRRILDPLLVDAGPGADISSLLSLFNGTGDSSDATNGAAGIGMLTRPFLSAGVQDVQQAFPADFPLGANQPRLYFLYVAHSQ